MKKDGPRSGKEFQTDPISKTLISSKSIAFSSPKIWSAKIFPALEKIEMESLSLLFIAKSASSLQNPAILRLSKFS